MCVHLKVFVFCILVYFVSYIYDMKKKKWFLISACVLGVAIGAFVFCAQNLNKGENYCYYNQTLVFNAEEKVLEGKEVVGFYNYTDTVLTKAYLHLYPNAFRENAKAKVVSLANEVKAYPNGKSYGNIQIETVCTKTGSLEYEIGGEDENILIIDFGQELYPDELIEFEVGFATSLANINHRLGYGENTYNLCNYYPVLCVYENGNYVTDLYHYNGDPFYSKISNYSVEITYPKDMTLASSGTFETTESEANKTSLITANKVRDFAMVLSEKFTVLCDSYKDIDINYYYYDDSNPATTMEVIKKTFMMNEKYGKYPYKAISVCEANFVHGGMEYPNIVLISDNLNDSDTYINVVVHELCHQWWYGLVGNNQFKYGFLDEGLTDFNTAMFYDEYPEYNHTSDEIFDNASKSYTNFVKVFSDVIPDFSTKMARDLDEFGTENEYVYLSYVKGMLMFSNLNDLLGKSKMTKCLKYYFECNKFKEATPDDLITAFNKASGKDLTSFFNSWFEGNVVIK